MKRHTVVTMPGDGIGASVLPAAVRVLEGVGFEADWVHADIGWRCWCEEGNALPDRTVELLREHRLGLFGASRLAVAGPTTLAGVAVERELADHEHAAAGVDE